MGNDPAGGMSTRSGDVPGNEKSFPSARHTGLALLLGVALFVLTVAVYWQAGSHRFIEFDDPDYVTANPHVATGVTVANVVWAFTSVHSSNWHPLTWLSLMTDAQLYGVAPGGYHLTNVAIHAVSSVLLFFLLFRLTRRLWQSSFVAALFALHPLHVESVAWVAERKDLLSAFFCFLTLFLYAAYAANRRKSLYLLALASFALGLMSKPMLVTFPVLMLLFDVWPLNRLQGQKADQLQPGEKSPFITLVREKIPFFALSVLSSLITVYAQHMGRAMNKVPFGLGVENAVLAYARYLAKMVWPLDLAIFYPFPAAIPVWQAIVTLIGLVLVSLATVSAARRMPYLMVGWFWYLVTLVPVIGLIPVGEQSIADRYTYLPLIGIFIIVSWGVPDLLERIPCRRSILALLSVACLSVLTVLTWQQLGNWRDGVTLFRHTLQLSPDSHTAHTMMGNAFAAKGDAGAAVKEYQAALAINPDYAKARRNWALLYLTRGNKLANDGKLDAAVTEFKEAIRIDPTFEEPQKNLALVHTNIGNNLFNRGQIDAAIDRYREAILIAPRLSDAHNNLGIALAEKGDLVSAIKEFQEALAINPGFVDARNNLDLAMAKRGFR